MQNYISLAGLEVAEKFVLGWVVAMCVVWFQVATVSNLNPRLEFL